VKDVLANLNDVLIPAKKKKYAVGLFNAINMEMGRGIVEAAEETGSPIIIGTAEVLLPAGPLDELSWYLLPLAKKAKVPVVVHYDHGLTYEKCIEALELGFTSIMYDCSSDNYEENIRKVKELVYVAHAQGATVEGELGHVGDNDEAARADATEFFTDPSQALDYVMRTGVDALAIAVGTLHGAYKRKPKLDFERISKIANTVSTPLVLHGGSGLTDEDFRRAIACGISKVNIFTDLNVAGALGDRAALDLGKIGKTEMIPMEVEAIKQAAKTKMLLFK
jgi:fructose-bisphosphate aldolase class II